MQAVHQLFLCQSMIPIPIGRAQHYGTHNYGFTTQLVLREFEGDWLHSLQQYRRRAIPQRAAGPDRN
jgi:hypothetical protein